MCADNFYIVLKTYICVHVGLSLPLTDGDDIYIRHSEMVMWMYLKNAKESMSSSSVGCTRVSSGAGQKMCAVAQAIGFVGCGR